MAMTMRERILAVIAGREIDRVPFVTYSGLAAPNEEVWDVIGRENMGLLRWCRAHRVETPNCRIDCEPADQDGLRGERRTLSTPIGCLRELRLFQPTYGVGAIKEHFVKEPRDYEVLTAYIDDGVVTEDTTSLHALRAELGDDGVPLLAVERTPYQQLWVEWVDMTDLACHLADCPERVHDCMDAMARRQRKIFEIVARAPADFVDFPDNITAPLIGERYFREHCVPFYNELGAMLADRNVPVFVHMDGDLRPLTGAIAESAVRGLDSFAPQPDNEMSVGEAAAAWPDMRLFTNFPSSVHLRSPQQVYEVAAQMLTEAGHSGRLQIQISENVPPGVWRTSYPAIVRAIHDFGRP